MCRNCRKCVDSFLPSGLLFPFGWGTEVIFGMDVNGTLCPCVPFLFYEECAWNLRQKFRIAFFMRSFQPLWSLGCGAPPASTAIQFSYRQNLPGTVAIQGMVFHLCMGIKGTLICLVNTEQVIAENIWCAHHARPRCHHDFVGISSLLSVWIVLVANSAWPVIRAHDKVSIELSNILLHYSRVDLTLAHEFFRMTKHSQPDPSFL